VYSNRQRGEFLDDFLNRVVGVTEGLWARIRPLSASSVKPKRNPWFDLLQLLVWAFGFVLLLGTLIVGIGQAPGESMSLYWRFGGGVDTPRGARAFLSDHPVFVVGRSGDRVRLRSGQAEVLRAGEESWMPVGPALYTGALANRYYAVQEGAARAMVSKSLGIVPNSRDTIDQATSSALGLTDPADWERVAGSVMLQYQPDNTGLRSSVEARELGVWVPEGWVCVLSGGETMLMEAQALQGIWGE
jgi:hypothetical protein